MDYSCQYIDFVYVNQQYTEHFLTKKFNFFVNFFHAPVAVDFVSFGSRTNTS